MSAELSVPAPARRRIPRKILLRFGVLVVLVLVALALATWSPLAQYFDREHLLELFRQVRGAWWTPVVILVLFFVIAPFGVPISPLVFSSGALFGVVWGTALNVAGLFLGSATSYALARWLGRDFVVHVAGDRLKRAEKLFEKRGFWPLVQVRFLPVPFPVVNYGAALAGVKVPLFLSSSAVGLVPMTLLHTYFAAQFAVLAERHATTAEFGRMGAIYVVAWGLFAAVTVGPSALAGWRRRQRYRRLVEERRRRV